MKSFLDKIGRWLKTAGLWFYGLVRHNLALKLVAVAFAIILWSYVLVTANPIREKTISAIPVTLSNYELVGSRGLVPVENIGGGLTARITVEANNDRLSYINSDNVAVTAEFSGITKEGSYRLALTGSSQYGTVIRVSPSYIDVTVEQLVTREIKVGYTVPAAPDGYWRDEVRLYPDTMTLSGPASRIDSIEKIEIALPEDDIREDVAIYLQPTLYDGNGRSIDHGNMEGVTSVLVTTRYLPTKEVPVTIDGSAAAAEGYMVGSIKAEPETVTIASPSSLIDDVTEVSTAPIALTGLIRNTELSVRLELPSEAAHADPDPVRVIVSIEEKDVTETFSARPVRAVQGSPDVSDMTVAGGLAGYADVVLTGPASVIKGITADMIDLYADVSGVTSGGSAKLEWRWIGKDHSTEDITVKIPGTIKVIY